MKAYTITPKGQVTIPAEIREKLKLYLGDKITYERRLWPRASSLIEKETVPFWRVVSYKRRRWPKKRPV